jgi:iron complex outermembrane recepter protein
MKQRIFSGAFVAALLGTCACASPLLAADGDRRPIDLPDGRLDRNLTALSRSLGQQILFSGDVTSGKISHRVHGQMTADEAMRALLQGTGLTYYRSARGVLIVVAQKPVVTPVRYVQDKPAPPPPPPEPVAVSEPAPTQGVEDIIVTARRVAENLQDVPTSISSFSSKEIAERRVTSAADLNGAAPNLTLRPISGTNFVTTIRGVSAGGLTNQSLDAGVSIYIDGVYLGRGFQAVANITDLDRVEVLRGPQGTLFGRNVTGGAVSFVTKNPSDAFSLAAEGTLGNYDQRRGKVTLNTGEWNGLSARVTYVHSEHRGWVRNEAAGIKTTFLPSGGKTGTGGSTDFSRNPLVITSEDSMGAENSETLLGTLQYTGIAGLKLDYKFDYNQTNYTQPLYQIAGFTTFAPFFPVPGVITVSPASRLSNAPGRMSSAAADLNGNNTIRTIGHNLTGEYAITPRITLKNIAAYRTLRTFSVSDLDGSDILVNPSAANPQGLPYFLSAQVAFRRQKQYSDELQLIGKTGRFEWILGGFYFFEKTFEQPINLAYTTLNAARVYTTTNADYGASSSYARGSARSLAAYAHGIYHLGDRIDLAAGLRYSADRKRSTLLGNCFFPNPALGDPIAARSNVDKRFTYCVPHAVNPANPNTIPGSMPGPRSSAATLSFDSVDWDASITYAIRDHVKAYARAASGYQSGGFINFYDFLPEKMISYEIGLKSEYFDRRLRVNGDLFYAHRRNAQQANYYGPTAGSHIDNLTFNTKGAELEVTAVPVPGLTLSSSGGYTKLDITNGTRQAVPKWNVALQGQYDFPHFGNGSYLSARMDANWVDRIPSNLPIPTFPGTTSVFGGTVDAAVTIPAQWTANARVSLLDIPLTGRATGHVALWGRNIFNDHSVNFGTDFVTVALVTYKPPRTLGVDFGFDF